MRGAKYIGLEVYQATISVVVLHATGKLVLLPGKFQLVNYKRPHQCSLGSHIFRWKEYMVALL